MRNSLESRERLDFGDHFAANFDLDEACFEIEMNDTSSISANMFGQDRNLEGAEDFLRFLDVPLSYVLSTGNSFKHVGTAAQLGDNGLSPGSSFCQGIEHRRNRTIDEAARLLDIAPAFAEHRVSERTTLGFATPECNADTAPQ